MSSSMYQTNYCILLLKLKPTWSYLCDEAGHVAVPYNIRKGIGKHRKLIWGLEGEWSN